MTRRWFRFVVLVILLTVAAAGCKKNPPAPPAAPADTPTTETSRPTNVAPPPTPTPTGDPVARPWSGDVRELTERAYREGLLGTVYFEFDSSALTADSRDRLARNAKFLTSDGTTLVLTIEGHCDERGTNQYNIALGERRSNAARDYLMSLGVDADRLRTISYGEEKPECTESAEACWQRNRRAYFRVTDIQ